MSESSKVQPHHLERGAYLYIRQSSMRQVLENVESTKRQYALRGRAVALGWHEDQIIVIDSDQGESGASAAWREGFQRLVTEVGMGHAGIVMGLVRWVEYGLLKRHAYNAHAYLYEMPDSNLPAKHCSRWDPLVDRVGAFKIAKESKPLDPIERGAV